MKADSLFGDGAILNAKIPCALPVGLAFALIGIQRRTEANLTHKIPLVAAEVGRQNVEVGSAR